MLHGKLNDKITLPLCAFHALTGRLLWSADWIWILWRHKQGKQVELSTCENNKITSYIDWKTRQQQLPLGSGGALHHWSICYPDCFSCEGLCCWARDRAGLGSITELTRKSRQPFTRTSTPMDRSAVNLIVDSGRKLGSMQTSHRKVSWAEWFHSHTLL